MPLTLETLLLPYGFDPKARMKLVRHRDHRYDIATIRRAGYFEFYQSIQSRQVFEKCDYIVSFIGVAGTHALFAGVYRRKDVSGPTNVPLPEKFPFPGMNTNNCYRYDLEHQPQFSELEGRLVIDWGRGVIKWVQNYRPNTKLVIELLPAGYVTHFPGFMNVVLSYEDLVSVIENPVSHRDWHKMLASVAGIYLILDTNTGDQYVGSASGKNGLLGRWSAYARRPDGGNVQLQALLQRSPAAHRRFQFSILQTLPTTLTKTEVVAVEVFHKQKLGSRAHGLNSN